MSAATLTQADYKLHCGHAISVDSTTMPPGTTAAAAQLQIINTAGRYLFKHPWKWRETGPAILAFAAPITVSDGTWTTSTKTLTKTSGFTNYSFVDGDIIEITDGTGATDGLYHIATRESANAITLVRDIGATNGSTDIDGEIQFPYVAMPSDFGELLWLEANGTGAEICLTTLQEVLYLRLKNLNGNANLYHAAIVHPGQSAASSAMPGPRLELDHAPSAADPDALFIGYRRCWTVLANDTSIPEIPAEAEDLLIEYIRAFAEGYMNRHGETNGIGVVTTQDRLQEIDESVTFRSLRDWDGLIQPEYGTIGDGPAGYPFYPSSWRSRTSGAVADPS